MANLNESPTYDPGVYQIETSDPVQGGDTGVSNKPLKNLANRTAYLKTRVDSLESGTSGNAPLNSPSFTGTPTAPTPPLGDNSTKIATTAFVQGTVNGILSKSVAGGANVSLTAVEAGNATLIFTGALTANIAVIVPGTAGQWIVSNRTTGAFSLTLKTAAGTGVAITQGKSVEAYCDATNVLLSTNDFVDVGLTGTPTAPSPAQFDISQKLVTTASMKAAGLFTSGIRTITATTALTVADVGSTILFGGVGAQTLTLPAANTVPAGFTITIVSTTALTATNTVKGAGSDTIGGAFGDGANSALLRGYDTVVLESNGNNSWAVMVDVSSNWFAKQLSLSSSASDLVPAGTVASFAMAAAPTGWLKANGAAISRSTYARLFNAIGTTFGTGDGSTTFALPDARGRFIRSLDDGANIDASRTLGSVQASQNLSHSHSGSTDYGGGHAHTYSAVTGNGAAGAANGNGFQNQGGYVTSTDGYHSHAVTTASSGGTEARPVNMALLTCIKF